MITNRKTRWFVMFVGVIACALVYFLVVMPGRSQALNQVYVSNSSCNGVTIAWNDVPTNYTPQYYQGNATLYCPWGQYTWTIPTYLLNEGQDYYWHSQPVSWGDIPRAGSNWNQCLFAGYVRYVYNGNYYNKYIEYPTGYDGYMDCWLTSMTFAIKDTAYLPYDEECDPNKEPCLPYPAP